MWLHWIPWKEENRALATGMCWRSRVKSCCRLSHSDFFLIFFPQSKDNIWRKKLINKSNNNILSQLALSLSKVRRTQPHAFSYGALEKHVNFGSCAQNSITEDDPKRKGSVPKSHSKLIHFIPPTKIKLKQGKAKGATELSEGFQLLKDWEEFKRKKTDPRTAHEIVVHFTCPWFLQKNQHKCEITFRKLFYTCTQILLKVYCR